jgi:hypothetical protein
MSFGYALDYGHPVVISVNLAIETILISLFYPLFVFSIRRRYAATGSRDSSCSFSSRSG